MVLCRFLGNACLEVIGVKDHIIVDPVFLSSPRKGIERILITHHHQDHIEISKIKEIEEKYSVEGRELEIYGPECLYEELNFAFTLIIPSFKISLHNGEIEVFDNDCWKAEGCVAYMISIDNKKILHTADSATFSSALRTLKNQVDVYFIACFVENFEDYLNFIQEISPKQVIPYHFSAGKEQNGKKISEYLKDNGFNSLFLSIGEELEL